MSIYACNGCDWVGHQNETVHPKHVESVSLCPECKETTEEVTPSWFKELREEAVKGTYFRSEFKKSLYWLIKIYIAIGREGWEEGPTEKEVLENILDFLANKELQPGFEDHAENVEKLLTEVEPDRF